MTQPTKKPAPQPAAKLATNVANKAAKSTYEAVESTRTQAENVVKIGSNAVKEFMATSADGAQKAHDKVLAITREGAENIAKSADAATKIMYETINASRGNVETCIECGNLTASFAKDISSELVEYTNKAFSDTLEISKEFFACRTINDMFELQNKIIKNTIDNFFNQSVRMSSMVFEYANETLDPINERVSETTEQFSKALSAA